MTNIREKFGISAKLPYICSPPGPDGGIGRRAGLKIQYPLKMYGFDSRSGHPQKHRSSLRCFFCPPALRYCLRRPPKPPFPWPALLFCPRRPPKRPFPWPALPFCTRRPPNRPFPWPALPFCPRRPPKTPCPWPALLFFSRRPPKPAFPWPAVILPSARGNWGSGCEPAA